MTDLRLISIALLIAASSICLSAAPARALGPQAASPWISDVFFYWYEWDPQQQWGSWGNGGVFYTPIAGRCAACGYYDSRLAEVNRREIETAADWGMTHHFMDYWVPDWKGEGGAPRDRIVMEAAEAARAAGYQAWMSYYQDGTNFAMRDFSRNVSEQRDVYNWLKNYAPFGAWPRLGGYPFQLVYGRNGAPEITGDDAGFRAFVSKRYGSLDALNAAWGAGHKSLDDIKLSFDVRGPQRADAVDYQYSLWEQEWAKLNQLVREQFGYPGIKASFDVGYGPFRGFGFCDFARVFGGPHSYGGVFGPPDEQDVERFVQSIVAKRYDTVFFDHLKGYYCDWNTLGRIPGTQYPADPFAYDRFWVGDLMRYDEAVLHLSWNEWWEGSNLEPSLELGKEYCEKNLFYSTLMQTCFSALRDFGKGASVAVLLNDWAFKCGSNHTSETYAVIQELRRSMVPFDLVVDDQVTPEMLRRFSLVFAPAAEVGFGRNARGDAIAALLAQWVNGGERRRLVASDCRQLRELLGLQLELPAQGHAPGPDLSLFVDVGERGDERYLVSGFSGREEWSQLPDGSFGRAGEEYTVRWAPADSPTLRLRLPASPNRNHVLRFAGSALRPSEAAVRVDGETVDRVQIEEGVHEYMARLPQRAIGGRGYVDIELVFSPPIIPKEIDPARFPNESRICNLALDWVQISTANLPFSRAQSYQPPSATVDFVSRIYGPLARKSREASGWMHDALMAPGAEVTARYRANGAPRDLLLHGGRILYVNGQMDDVAPREWVAALVEDWAGERAPVRVSGDSIIGTALRADNTLILLAYNYDPSQARGVEFRVRAVDRGVAQVTALRRDGDALVAIPWRTEGDHAVFSDTVRYFGVYEVVLAPVKIEVGEAVLHPGEQGRVPVTTTAGSDAVKGTVSLVSVIPTVAMVGPAREFQVAAGESARIEIPVVARKDVDWGHKTIGVRVETASGAAMLFRTLEVEPNPHVEAVATLLDGRQPRLTLGNTPPPGARKCGRARGVTVEVDGREVSFGDIAGGGRATRALPLTQPFAGRPRLMKLPARISYDLWGERAIQDLDLTLAVIPIQAAGPADALAAVYVFNPSDAPLDNYPVVVALPSSVGALSERLYVEDDEGRPLPTQVDPGAELSFIGRAPAKSAATFYLVLAPTAAERPLAPGRMELAVEPRSRTTGTVRLSNSRLSLVLSAPRGGTLSSLKSQSSGHEYAADSLGVTYGAWAKPVDPASPARQPQQFIDEQRVRQSASPAQVEVLASGPVRAVARATWEDDKVRCRQTYELRAYQPYVRVVSEVAPKRDFAAQELVLLDGRFRSAGLTKIFPGFSGMLGQFEGEHPHFGWREVAYVPEVATMMTPPRFAESLSLVFVKTGDAPASLRSRAGARPSGADRWRQGFWPEQRPRPGTCKYAWCELISTREGRRGGAPPARRSAACEVEAYVLLHHGNQAAAQAFKDAIEHPPLTAVVEVSQESKRLAPLQARAVPADWWSPYWPIRVPVRVKTPADAALPATATARIALSALPGPASRAPRAAQKLDLNSVRVIEVDDNGHSMAALPVSSAQTDDNLLVAWPVLPDAAPRRAPHSGASLAAPVSPWRAERTYYVYFDTEANGPRAPEPAGTAPSLAVIADPSLEQEDRYWALEGTAQFERGDAHRGSIAARLESDGKQGLGLLKAPDYPAAANAQYGVSFWAKALEGPGLLRVNFFIDAAHDYPQEGVQVLADGQWHRVEVIARTGDMPAGTRPALRIWAIERKQVTLVDDVAVEGPQAADVLRVDVGIPEAL